MAIKHRYQLILLGTISPYKKDILDQWNKSIKELGLLADAFNVIDQNNFYQEYKSNQPCFVIYFGHEYASYENITEVQMMLDDGNLILPVYHEHFDIEIPDILENQNAIKYHISQISKITNLALESFGKLRDTRKVFVSYKRSESTSVAIQLYEALERNNFDVFLDTHSIKQGEPFQDELWHRMTDADVIIMLNTPKFMESKWCKEEVAEASAKQIGIVQLVWPEHTLENFNLICEHIALLESDFVSNIYQSNTSRLKEVIIERIVETTESLRARNLAARQDGLISEFLETAKKYGREIIQQPQRFLTEEKEEGMKRVFIPTVGIPQSINCDQSREIKKELQEIDEIHLIYDDLRIRDKWLGHLDWLNNYLDVKTLKKQNFDKWLSK